MSEDFVTTRIPRQLIESDTKGKGAAEIGWGTPGDFDRCRAFMRRHGVEARKIDGACANLHKIATGEWPGKNAHKGSHSLEMYALTAAMGDYTAVPWRGPLAPIGSPTGDGRLFPPSVLTFQSFPMPLRWQEHAERGHDGAVTVGVIEGAEEGTGPDGKPMIMAYGYFLNPDIIPEVTKALHQVEHGVAGPSVDLDTYTARLMEYSGKTVQAVAEGRVRAATLVAVPAFADLRLQLNPAEPPVDFAATPPDGGWTAPTHTIYGFEEFVVNGASWHGAPLAPRDALFDADDAVKRIQAWAQNDGRKMASMFLWVDPQSATGAILGKEGYRLPWGDIIDGKPYLIYHAIYAGAALLEDGHGGLPNIPDGDKEKLRNIISEIYAHMSEKFDDPEMRASWDKRSDEQTANAEVEQFAVRSSGWSDLPIADGAWDEGAARSALDSWAGDDMGKYARGFLWAGPDRENKTNYKFPIAKPVDGKLTIFISAVNNAKARLSSANIPAADKTRILGILNSIQSRHGGREEMSLTAALAPVHPPKEWFSNPQLKQKTKPQVADNGRIFGHLAVWDGCHRGRMSAANVCTTPPRSSNDYVHFHTGTTKTAEGDLLDTGVIVWDTTHAPEAYGARAAVAHYEHTGQAVADVRLGEDEYGIWFSGTLRPNADEAVAQKFRQTPLSGDWRRLGNRLELVGALAVNAPGFPILASLEEEGADLDVTVHFTDGIQTCLIASFAEFDVAEVSVAEPPADEGCGCPDIAAALADRPPLLSVDELKMRDAKIAGYEMI